ncbi:MAG: hypothetical protein ABI955_14390, partial [Nitrospirota bacterium]
GAIFMKLGRAPAIRSIRFMVCLDQHAYTLDGALVPLKRNSSDDVMADLGLGGTRPAGEGLI